MFIILCPTVLTLIAANAASRTRLVTVAIGVRGIPVLVDVRSDGTILNGAFMPVIRTVAAPFSRPTVVMGELSITALATLAVHVDMLAVTILVDVSSDRTVLNGAVMPVMRCVVVPFVRPVMLVNGLHRRYLPFMTADIAISVRIVIIDVRGVPFFFAVVGNIAIWRGTILPVMV